MWGALFGWAVIGVVVPVLIGFGVGVMSMSPPEFLISKVCFSVAGLLLIAKTGVWFIATQSRTLKRWLFLIVVIVGIGVLWVISMRWVSQRESIRVVSEEDFTKNVQSWLNDSGFSVQKITNEKCIFIFNAITHNGSTVVINWPKDNKEIIFLNVVMLPNEKLKHDIEILNKDKKDIILSKIKIELLKQDISFRNVDPTIPPVVLEDSVPIVEIKDKLYLREKILKLDRVSKIYTQILYSELSSSIK